MTKHPRVAIVGPSLEILGGQGVQAHALARALRLEGYRVKFVPVNPRFPKGLGWVRRIPYLRTLLNEALYLASLGRLRHADVVHVFSASYWSFLLAPVPVMLAARLFGKRVVLNYHSGEAADHLERWGRLVHPWLRLAHQIVVPSEYLRAVFARYGYDARVVHNVVDLARFRYRERARLRPRLISTRNLEKHYGVDNTLRAFALVRERYPDATLVVAGYGSQESRLRQLAERLGTRGIRFVGRVEPEAMPRLYDGADLFVNSSLVDNQPLSVLEAFSAGLPVVSTPTGGIGALVRDGETGILVPGGEPSALAAAVVGLVEEPAFARALAARAKHDVELYSWPRVRQNWAAVYAGAAA